MNNILHLFKQLFDEGHNIVSMNLPTKPEKKPADPVDEPATAALQILDVEYDDDYDNAEHHQKQTELSKIKVEQDKTATQKHSFSPPMRDYSINTWNGSPGLHFWGYDDSSTDG